VHVKLAAAEVGGFRQRLARIIGALVRFNGCETFNA
jgi:hypothetical protein